MTARRALLRSGLATCLALAATLAMAMAPASSWGAPRDGFRVTLACPGATYQAIVAGNGEFTPAHLVGTRKHLVPHEFGPFTGTVHDASGAVVATFTEPGSVQGSGKQKKDVTCRYSFTFHDDGSDPTIPPGGSFSGAGHVIGKITGRR